MEDGDLIGFIEEKKRRSGPPCIEYQAQYLAKQLFTTLDYLHNSQNIIHCDVKLDNILIDKNKLNLKLTDFGYASKFRPGISLNKNLGSVSYMCPEMLNKQPYDQRADVWSATIVVYGLMTGFFPFQGNTEAAYLQSI